MSISTIVGLVLLPTSNSTSLHLEISWSHVATLVHISWIAFDLYMLMRADKDNVTQGGVEQTWVWDNS